MNRNLKEPQSLSSGMAFRFVLTLGIANLFADMTYEGARSMTGAFLGWLGAGAAVVGFTAGLGELLGYGLRSLTGFLSDRTGKYWLVTFTGYVINLLAVPALALAGSWPVAAALMVAERTGRAIRKPATGAMLSFAGQRMGQGWVFGLNEALDQAGAALGPLLVSLVLFLGGGYAAGFGVLLAPALLTLAVVGIAWYFFPRPHDLEAGRPLQAEGLSRPYWLYLLAGACIAAGFADFALIAYHFQQTKVVPVDLIPVLYAVAMAAAAVGALVFGRLFDRAGSPMLLIAFTLSAFFAPLVFWGDAWAAGAGMVLWGLGMGAQESLLRAAVAGVVAPDRRATAFGVFDTGFGIAWFLGSWLMGVLYGQSLTAVVVLAVTLQLAAVPILFLAGKGGLRGAGPRANSPSTN